MGVGDWFGQSSMGERELLDHVRENIPQQHAYSKHVLFISLVLNAFCL